MGKLVFNFLQQANSAALVQANMADLEMRALNYQLTEEQARELIREFELRYADIIAAFRRAGDIYAHGGRVMLDYKTRLDALPPLPEPTGGPPTDKRLRYSSKTGATWPKPKRSY